MLYLFESRLSAEIICNSFAGEICPHLFPLVSICLYQYYVQQTLVQNHEKHSSILFLYMDFDQYHDVGLFVNMGNILSVDCWGGWLCSIFNFVPKQVVCTIIYQTPLVQLQFNNCNLKRNIFCNWPYVLLLQQ